MFFYLYPLFPSLIQANRPHHAAPPPPPGRDEAGQRAQHESPWLCVVKASALCRKNTREFQVCQFNVFTRIIKDMDFFQAKEKVLVWSRGRQRCTGVPGALAGSRGTPKRKGCEEHPGRWAHSPGECLHALDCDPKLLECHQTCRPHLAQGRWPSSNP